MILGVDIDNTITDTMDLIAQYWTDQGYVTNKDELDFDGSYVRTPPGMTLEQRSHMWEDGSEWLLDAEPFPGAKLVLSLLGEHEVHLITARTPHSEKIREVTKQWLEKQGFIYDSLHHIDGKVDDVRRMGIQVMFEDNPDEAVPIAEAGIPVLLKDQPYNKDVQHPLIMRFTHWVEVPVLLQRLQE